MDNKFVEGTLNALKVNTVNLNTSSLTKLDSDIEYASADVVATKALQAAISALDGKVNALEAKLDSKMDREDCPWLGSHEDSVNAEKMVDLFLNEEEK